MDGFTYEQTFGGWQVCNICGVRVSDTTKHTASHATTAASGGIVCAFCPVCDALVDDQERHAAWHREQEKRYRWVDAPDWAITLLNAVEEYEDTHPWADECLAGALQEVPGEARIFAAGVRKANRNEER